MVRRLPAHDALDSDDVSVDDIDDRSVPDVELAAIHRSQETLLHREASQVEQISYTFSPRFNAYAFAPQFGSLQTEIDPRDRTELERIAGEWRGMRQLSIKVVGHADRTPISPRGVKSPWATASVPCASSDSGADRRLER